MCLLLSVTYPIPQSVLYVVCVSKWYVYVHTNTLVTGSELVSFMIIL